MAPERGAEGCGGVEFGDDMKVPERRRVSRVDFACGLNLRLSDDDDPIETLTREPFFACLRSRLMFTVSLTLTSPSAVTVGYAATPGTATTDDYTVTGDRVTFPALASGSDLTAAFEVDLLDDALDEADETFTVSLTVDETMVILDPSGSRIEVTIVDNDNPPALSLSLAGGPRVMEDRGALLFTVTLGAASG